MMHGGDGGDIKALRTTAWLTGIYFIIEIGIGLYTGSIAVISDALHTFSAVGGVPNNGSVYSRSPSVILRKASKILITFNSSPSKKQLQWILCPNIK
jgi:hypothetical protein